MQHPHHCNHSRQIEAKNLIQIIVVEGLSVDHIGQLHISIFSIRSQNVSFEAKNLNNIISLDELAKDEVRSKHHFIADPTRQTPEQIYLAQEQLDDTEKCCIVESETRIVKSCFSSILL